MASIASVVECNTLKSITFNINFQPWPKPREETQLLEQA